MPTAVLAAIPPFLVIGGRKHQKTVAIEIIVFILKPLYFSFLTVVDHRYIVLIAKIGGNFEGNLLFRLMVAQSRVIARV
jgi:hypothetical protein